MTQPQEAENITHEIIDGYLYDTETGECLGMAQAPAFQIDSADSLNWVMDKMLQAEAAISAIDTSEAVLHAKAIIANAEKMKKPLHSRLDWLHKRFDAEIAEYVRPLLEGQKTKTYRTLYGSIAFRTVKGGLRVVDKAESVRVSKLCYPNAVRTTEDFLISLLTAEQVTELTNGLSPDGWGLNDATRKAFAVLPDEEKVSVKTGIDR